MSAFKRSIIDAPDERDSIMKNFWNEVWNELLEMVKRWYPAVIAVITYISLMAGLSNILGNYRLVILITIASIIALIIGLCFHFIFGKKKSLLDSTMEVPAHPSLIFPSMVVLIFVAILISVTLILPQPREFMKIAFIGPPTPLAVPRAQPPEVLVLVAEFKGDAKYNSSDRIFSQIESDLEKTHLAHSRIAQIPNVLTTSEQAQEIGQTYGATIVIWGFADSFGVTPHFEVIQKEKSINVVELGQTVIDPSDPGKFTVFVTKDMGAELSYLSLFTIGQIAYFDQDYDQASALFESAIKALPESTKLESGKALGLSNLYFFRGYIYHVLRSDLQKAAIEYNNALQYDSGDPSIHYNLGDVLRRSGDSDGAIQHFGDSIKLDPNHFKAFYSRGTIYLEKNDFSNAIDDFTRAISVNTAFSGIYYARGKAYYLRGMPTSDKSDFMKAADDFNQAIRLSPDYADAFLGQARAYYQIGEYEKAISDYQDVIRFSPTNSAAYNELAWIYVDKLETNLDKALLYSENALKLAKEQNLANDIQADYLDTQAWIYYKKGNISRAKQILQEARRMTPNNPDIQKHWETLEALP
jgi:tetratricopeptide (TPR) repeat protein